MATTVSQIVDAAEAQLSTTLGATWRKLPFVWDLEKNDSTKIDKAYGVRPLSAVQAATATNLETLDHTFDFTLSRSLPRYDSDDDVQTILDTLYDKADQIFRQFVLLKLGLSGTVIKVDERSMEEPLITANGVFLRVRFVVKYRQSL